MCWCGLQTIYQFLNHVNRPSKTEPMINNVHHAFSRTCHHICCAFGAGRKGQNGLLSQKCPQAGSVCKQKKTCATPFPIGGKGCHTNQSQNYMANHVIWLLRNRGKLWEGWRRKSDSNSDGNRVWRVERFVTFSVFGEYCERVVCYVVFGVVCLVCSEVVFCLISQNNEETAECGTGRKELREAWAWGTACI